MQGSATSFGRMPTEPAEDLTEDAVLGGRLVLWQPRRGHRVGHDAILLAAAADGRSGDRAIELGAGVGAAGLALARRIAGLQVTLVEIDATLAELARRNAGRNGLSDRVQVATLDVLSPDDKWIAAGITRGSAKQVLMNPPFNDPARQKLSPDPQRRLAHAGSSNMLGGWVSRAAWLLAPSGVLTLIWRADGLADVLAVLSEHFGGVAVLPVHPRPDAAAIRVLIQATKGSRAPLAIVPALTLNDATARPTDAAEAVLRGGEALR
jgi:tRNA1(Val) A37 N6-methylase TrmN6